MKKFIVKIGLFFATLFLIFSCNNKPTSPKDSFTVSGTVNGLNTKYMQTSFTGLDGKRVSDSVLVNNNHFSYTSKIDKPTFIIFWPFVENTIKRSGGGYYPVKSSQFAFLANPGDQIEFKGSVSDFIDAYPTGTKANDDLASINRVIFPLMNQSINIQLRKNNLPKNHPDIQKYQDSIDALDQTVLNYKKEFVAKNPSSEAAVWYLSDMMSRSQVSNEEAVAAFKQLNKSLKDNPFYKTIDTRIQGIESTKIGAIMPNFSTNKTLDGTKFELSSLRGKYVLVDFWGTWCGPCVGEMPTVKEYQKKYPKRFAVLGVNSGESVATINKFIQAKDYDWQQIINGQGDDNFVLKFNVKAYPTKFILDPNGKILYKFVGSGEESFNKLDELLK